MERERIKLSTPSLKCMGQLSSAPDREATVGGGRAVRLAGVHVRGHEPGHDE